MNQNAADTVYWNNKIGIERLACRMHMPWRHHSYEKNNMSEPLKVFPSLVHKQLEGHTDQELAQSYFELQELREQVRIAECGRALLIPGPHDLRQIVLFREVN
jgi:hypothetical protein